VNYLKQAKRGLLRVGSALWSVFPASHYMLLALLFIAGLELIFALQRFVVVLAITVVGIVTIGVIAVKVEEGGRWRLVHSVLPILATVGLSGFAFLLPTSPILHLYIVASGLALFFLLKHGAREAYPIWNWALSLLIYLLNISFVLGIRFHLYMPVLVVLGAVLVISALMSWQALMRIVPAPVDAMLPVLAMTLVLTQTTWALQFLPAHYLVQAGIITILYYVIFSVVSLSYTRKITRWDIMEYLGIGAVASVVLVVFARWT